MEKIKNFNFSKCTDRSMLIKSLSTKIKQK